MMDELVKKNINYIYDILIEIQDYMQSIYNPNDASEVWTLNNINNNINKAIRRIEVIEEILKHQSGMSTRAFDTKAKASEAWNKVMGEAVSYPCTNPNGVYTSDCTNTNTTDPNEDFHPIRNCMVGAERVAKVETMEKPNVYKCSECGQYTHRTAWSRPVKYCTSCGVRLDWSGNE